MQLSSDSARRFLESRLFLLGILIFLRMDPTEGEACQGAAGQTRNRENEERHNLENKLSAFPL